MKWKTNSHISYCSNMHPAETWLDTFAALRNHVPAIRSGLGVNQFGIGLRLSGIAAKSLDNDAHIPSFMDWLDQEQLYVFTLNGFPYGPFHGTAVKEHVYDPDWLDEERVRYTLQLATLISKILPKGLDGGISTCPVAYKFNDKDRDQVLADSVIPMMQVVLGLKNIEEETGKHIHLDIEPEPDGMLETTDEFIRYFEDYLLNQGSGYLSAKGVQNPERMIRHHIQLCYDVCHFAVTYEDPEEVVKKIREAGISIGKMQVSSALKVDMKQQVSQKLQQLSRFNEPVYLHQSVGRKGTDLIRFRDLPQFLDSGEEIDEVRVHYHVPLFVEYYHLLESTQADVRKALAMYKRDPFTNHLEVETYTWDILPDEMKLGSVDSILREINWLTSQLA